MTLPERITLERARAKQCIIAIQSELDTLNRWQQDPGGLNPHNLDGIIALGQQAKAYLARAVAWEEIKP